MGISKQMQMEEMHRVSVLEYDEDAAWCAKENYEAGIMTFEEACEDDLIERSIEDDAIKADMKRQDDEIRKAKNNE
jgi:hypothetical protein